MIPQGVEKDYIKINADTKDIFRLATGLQNFHTHVLSVNP